MMATKRDPEAMTGAEFARLRAELGLTQTEIAKLLGLGLRTVIRFEGSAMRKRFIPLTHAKHLRCKARELAPAK